MQTVDNVTSSFAALLSARRRACGLTQAMLARQSGCSRQYIAQLEHGTRVKPSAEVAQALARSLGLSGEQREAFLLAAGRQRPAAPDTATPPVSLVATRLLDQLPLPALLHDACWQIRYANRLLVEMFTAQGFAVENGTSLLTLAFSAEQRPNFPGWEPWARALVAQFKRDSRPLLGTPGHQALLGELRRLPDFRRFWQSTDAAEERATLLPLHYCVHGQQATFTVSRLQFVETPQFWGVVLLPESAAAQQLLNAVKT